MTIDNDKQKNLRIGIIIEQTDIPAWAAEMLQKLQEANYAEIVALIRLPDALVAKRSKPLLYNFFERLEKRLVKFSYDPFSLSSIKDILPDVEMISSDTIGADLVDVLIAINVSNLPDEFISFAKYGVWIYQHGSDPIGFWEVVNQAKVTRLSLVQHSSEGEIVLADSFSPTDTPFVLRNCYYYVWKMAIMIPSELKRLAYLGEEEFYALKNTPALYSQTKPSTKGISNSTVFLLKLITFYLRYLVGKLSRFFTKPQWILLYQLGNEHPQSYEQYQPMIPPNDRFWADPMVIYRDNRYYIFIEELLFKNNKGYIAVIEMDENGKYSEPITVLEQPFHLSYPFIFEYKDDLYMIPESAENHTIDLYKCEQFPHQWEYQQSLMTDVEAYDTTLIEYDGKWWMFTTLQEHKVGSTCDDLYLFYSDDPLTNEWHPHPLNPIVSDARRARMAGKLYELNGILYRPAQDDSLNYGYGIRIHRILSLSISDYKEEEVEFIEPNWTNRYKGVHTFSQVSALTVIDAVQRVAKS